jgi:hypothetical protein
MSIALNVPQAVRQSTPTGASYFLLLRGPIRKLDLVREKNAASHDMNKTELGLNGSETLLCDSTMGLLLDNLDSEQVVGVALKALVTVGRDLVLPVSLSDRGTNIVRMQAAVGRAVVKTENGAILDVLRLGKGIPRMSTVNGLPINSKRLSLVLEKPDIVVVLVGVQGDLLLLAASRVHERVGVKITALGVHVADGNTAAHHDIGRDILHSLVVESGLELGAHEAIAVTGVLEADKMDGEHSHVECERNDNKTENSGHEVLGEKTLDIRKLRS